MGVVKRLTGRTGTPVLVHDGGALDGSARILGWLDAHAGSPRLKQFAYGCTVPLAAPLVRKGNGISGTAIADGQVAAVEALDLVDARSAATGYLVGDSFTIADLTAASTLAVLVRPVDSPMSCPEPVAPAFRALMDRYASHPGATWVRRVYAQHRVARRDFEGEWVDR